MMRCTNCGMPLSPTKTSQNCPRCLTSNGAGTPAASIQTEGSYPSQSPFPQADQMWHPTPTTPSASLPQLQPLPPSNWLPPSRNDRRETPRTPKTRPGFIVAALCVITGGLILVFVYFMAAALPPSSGTATPVNAGTPSTSGITLATQQVPPSPTVASPILSPTPGAFPGQQYIDNPQLASKINTNTAYAIQVTTTFKVGQQVYLTFNLHPNGQNGAVCLLWYLNSINTNSFKFAVAPNSSVGYAYTFYGSAGSAYVEIYWASTTACTDKLLAQHIDFTVIN